MLAESSLSIRDDVIKGLVAGGLGLAGTVITAALSWIKDRDQSANRIRVIEEANKRVRFWDSWSKMITPLGAAEEAEQWRSKAKAEALDASKSVEAIFASHSVVQDLARSSDFQSRRKAIPSFRRWLLLYKPPRALAWLPRLFFYIYGVLIVVSLIEWIVSKDANQTDNATSLLIGSLVLCAIFRPLSVWLEKPRQQSQEGP
jgi:hypothetical protein